MNEIKFNKLMKVVISSRIKIYNYSNELSYNIVTFTLAKADFFVPLLRDNKFNLFMNLIS